MTFNLTSGLAVTLVELPVTSVVFSFAASQDLQVTVKTGDESFDSEKANVDYQNEYYYKLRVRTGLNDVTNLIIYDSLGSNE